MEVVAATRQWLASTIVGLDLCPYARGPIEAGRVRVAVAGGDQVARLEALAREVEHLLASDARDVETTLLIVPDAPAEFEAFLDETDLGLDVIDAALDEVQVVVFHPKFCFADAADADPGNATNRSPAPLWHLLRQASVDRVVDADPEGVAAIPERNRQRLLARARQ